MKKPSIHLSTAALQKSPAPNTSSRVWVSVLLLFGFLIVATFTAALFSRDVDDIGANTAIIRLIGPIYGDGSSGVFSDGVVGSTQIIELLEEARDDDAITAVILEINSPGGSAVASDEIAQAVKEVRAQNKTVVAWIREEGASGAYWIASSTDYVVANRMSITASIGVIGSYLEFDEFIDDWNVSYNRLVAGDRKDVGDPFVNLNDVNKAFIQTKMNKVHRFFIEEVAQNRKLTIAETEKIADGQFMLGVEAKDAGLVDELGGKDESIAYIEEKTGAIVITTVFEHETGLLEELFGIFSSAPQPSVAESVKEQVRGRLLERNSPVPMLR